MRNKWILFCSPRETISAACLLSVSRNDNRKMQIYFSSIPFSRLRLNSLRPRQNDRHFTDDTFKCIFLNEYVRISIRISLKFVPKGPINSIPVLLQIMAWRRPGDRPLSEVMIVSRCAIVLWEQGHQLPQWWQHCDTYFHLSLFLVLLLLENMRVEYCVSNQFQFCVCETYQKYSTLFSCYLLSIFHIVCCGITGPPWCLIYRSVVYSAACSSPRSAAYMR